MNAPKYSPKECIICGRTFTPRSSQSKTCDRPECKRELRRGNERRYWRSEKGKTASRRRVRNWRETDKGRESTREWNQSEAHREANLRYLHSDRGREVGRAASQRRRARKREATVETFVDTEIFERDNWTCGICREAIDPALSHPDPMSVSLDHVVPLAQGGSHERSNVQASHLVCNLRKGARPQEEVAA